MFESDTLRISLYRGDVDAHVPGAFEVNIGSRLPSAWSGLRVLLSALREQKPAAIEAIARQHPQEWNNLFPGSMPEDTSLADLALTPSERRLHRESEQVYRTLNVAAEAIVETLRQTDGQLVLRNTGRCDLVSLRGLMRACEWLRLDHRPYTIIFADWENCSPGPERLVHVRQLLSARLATRLDAAPQGAKDTKNPLIETAEAYGDLENTCLQLVMSDEEPEARVAAAILAIRCCFYSTNYEGALLAISQALKLLDSCQASFSVARMLDHFATLDDGNVAPAIEIDREDMSSESNTRALLWRSLGVVQSFIGDHGASFDAFKQALDVPASPEMQAQLHMYLGLVLAKRMQKTDESVAVLQRGLSLLEGRTTTRAALEEAWLRNVMGLTFFQQRNLQAALLEEKRAASVIGQHHTPTATHLKINLISNISVLQEAAKRYTDAIQTWNQFAKVSSEWGGNFLKHHTYRLAGLQLAAGDETALQGYEDAYECAVRLGDRYHCQIIASELGRCFLEKEQLDQAAEWFRRAQKSAEALGDPFRIGENMIGAALSTGEDPRSGVITAQITTTYRGGAQHLLDALDSNQLDSLLKLLPKLRTKLNRPFDVVNLNL